jgi:hypothetical protein
MWCRAEGSKPLPMSFEAPQAVETACDECAGDGQLAYDLEATMWVPAPQPRTGPPTAASGSVCSTACNATAPARCGSIRDAAILRRDPAGNSARACGVPYDDQRLAQVDHASRSRCKLVIFASLFTAASRTRHRHVRQHRHRFVRKASPPNGLGAATVIGYRNSRLASSSALIAETSASTASTCTP